MGLHTKFPAALEGTRTWNFLMIHDFMKDPRELITNDALGEAPGTPHINIVRRPFLLAFSWGKMAILGQGRLRNGSERHEDGARPVEHVKHIGWKGHESIFFPGRF
jgi:hypothetical protein